MTEANTAAAPVEVMAYSEPGQLPAVRAFTRQHAQDLGLGPDDVESLVIAVSELATNTLQHTSGGGRVRIWAEHGQVVCDVVDGGPLRSLGRQMPAADAVRGRGLAIVERLCDQVDAIAGPDGTAVRLRFALTPRTV
ncbi:ATP-binding protein [Actinoplanes sp. DH11]|uniref:ATP-binding protein n=1 Tax=Actinoplanes sp. DH11 TaxID=2857011 RepID=UPI001E2E978B|nr:ATP-binding protein [Actinoplanes sp. DH11]